MGRYIKPEYGAKKFTCPYCETLAEMKWVYMYPCIDGWGNFTYSSEFSDKLEIKREIGISNCGACDKTHIWCDKKIVVPEDTGVEMPVEDMPEEVKEIYEEARVVYPKSSKAAAALLRLALQILCKELGYEGTNINSDIAKMVKDGLSPKVQKAFDIIRVTGNEAVHPGVIDFNDNDDIALKLFSMLNFIVDKMITEPKEIDELYNQLPANKLTAIDKRDNK